MYIESGVSRGGRRFSVVSTAVSVFFGELDIIPLFFYYSDLAFDSNQDLFLDYGHRQESSS